MNGHVSRQVGELIMRLAAEGRSLWEVAEISGASERTVKEVLLSRRQQARQESGRHYLDSARPPKPRRG